MQKNMLHKAEYKIKTIGDFVNNFAEIANIDSTLLYGDPSVDRNPWVSLVIPTYNRYELFRHAVKSTIKQRPVDYTWEIVVIDNTPLDEHGETPALQIIKEIGEPRVLYYHNSENIGAGYSWNRGVELARGKWVSFLHDDDVLCSDALFNIGNIIRRNENLRKPLGYIHARRRDFTDVFNEREAKKHDKNYEQELTRTGALVRGCSQTGAPSCGTSILKEACLRVGGFSYAYGGTADAVLGYKIMKDYTVLHSGKVLGGYRWQENDSLRKSTILNLVEADLLFARYRYSLTPGSRLFGRLFWRVQHNLNIEGKLGLARKGHHDMDRHDFDHIVAYKESNRVMRFLYKMVQQLYHQIEKRGRIYFSEPDEAASPDSPSPQS